VLCHLLALCLSIEQVGGLGNTWIMDSGRSQHMTGNAKLFSSLTPMKYKEYITFGVNSKGRVVSHGSVRVNESFILKNVALVSNLHLNLLSVSQLHEDDLVVCFK